MITINNNHKKYLLNKKRKVVCVLYCSTLPYSQQKVTALIIMINLWPYLYLEVNIMQTLVRSMLQGVLQIFLWKTGYLI